VSEDGFFVCGGIYYFTPGASEFFYMQATTPPLNPAPTSEVGFFQLVPWPESSDCRPGCSPYLSIYQFNEPLCLVNHKRYVVTLENFYTLDFNQLEALKQAQELVFDRKINKNTVDAVIRCALAHKIKLPRLFLTGIRP